MTRVVVIAPTYSESRTPEGLCARALAEAFAARGHTVEVLVGNAGAPRAGHACEGRVSVTRVSVRRGSPRAALAVEIARRVVYLASAGRCDAVEIVGFPEADAALRFVRALAEVHTPTVNLEGDFRFPDCGAAWEPPACEGPVLCAVDAIDEASQSRIVRAYRASGVADLGWDLALLGRDGQWNLLGGGQVGGETGRATGRASGLSSERTDVVTIALGSSAPIAALRALGAGCMCIAGDGSPLVSGPRSVRDAIGDDLIVAGADETAVDDSLARAMRAAAGLDDSTRRRRAESAYAMLSAVHRPDDVVDEHERLWAMGSAGDDHVACRPIWAGLEKNGLWGVGCG